MAVITECVRADPQSCHRSVSLLFKNYFLFTVITPMAVFDHAEAFAFLSPDFLFPGNNDNFLPPSDPFVCCFRCLRDQSASSWGGGSECKR